jgi:diacylglycerol kinase family enzyme
MTSTPEHLRRACLVINAGAGQILSTGPETVEHMAREALGDEVRIIMAAPEHIQKALETAFGDEQYDTVIAGGGDGTVASAGKLALHHGKTLGVLPLGTMNLFARALGMPQALAEAFPAIRTTRPALVDVAEVNGELFFNHMSVGLHARMIRLRERMSYTGRLTKILGSLLALRRAVAGAPLRRISVKAGASRPRRFRSALTVVTVNPVPDRAGQLPFRPGQDHGRMGCYMYAREGVSDIAVLLADLAAGNWSQNTNLEFLEATRIKLDSARQMHASLDGEVRLLKPPLRLGIRPKALRALTVDYSGDQGEGASGEMMRSSDNDVSTQPRDSTYSW